MALKRITAHANAQSGVVLVSRKAADRLSFDVYQTLRSSSANLATRASPAFLGVGSTAAEATPFENVMAFDREWRVLRLPRTSRLVRARHWPSLDFAE